MKAVPLLALTFATMLHAQDLAPELAPLAAKYKAALAALDAQKAATLARVQQTYGIALDAAEKTATTAGSIEAIAAITKEREALKSGPLAPAWPENLPKALQAARKAFLDGAARVSADETPRRKAVDADYLRALASLQPKAAGKPELAAQIAAEKEKVLGMVPAGGRPTSAEELKRYLISAKWAMHPDKPNGPLSGFIKFNSDGTFQYRDQTGSWSVISATKFHIWGNEEATFNKEMTQFSGRGAKGEYFGRLVK